MSSSHTSIVGASYLWHERPESETSVKLSTDTAQNLNKIVASVNDEIGHNLISPDDIIRLAIISLNGDIDEPLPSDQRDRIGPIIDHINSDVDIKLSLTNDS